jgi:hypothetical protein
VIATQDEEIFWVLYPVGKKKADSFQRLFASVNVVTQEQVVCFGRISAIIEESQNIIVLAMNITTNLNLQEDISKQSSELHTIA